MISTEFIKTIDWKVYRLFEAMIGIQSPENGVGFKKINYIIYIA